MQFTLKKTKDFSPLSIQITLKTLAEAKEFQLRMSLYWKELEKARPQAAKDVMGASNSGHQGSKMENITHFRNELALTLGEHAIPRHALDDKEGC